jgi:hypothetical protein
MDGTDTIPGPAAPSDAEDVWVDARDLGLMTVPDDSMWLLAALADGTGDLFASSH